MTLQSKLLCPVCGETMDVITHLSGEVNDFSIAMLGGDGRREHRKVKPECSKDPNWVMGWIVKTEDVLDVEIPAQKGPSSPEKITAETKQVVRQLEELR